jgi:hypothetical protein
MKASGIKFFVGPAGSVAGSLAAAAIVDGTEAFLVLPDATEALADVADRSKVYTLLSPRSSPSLTEAQTAVLSQIPTAQTYQLMTQSPRDPSQTTTDDDNIAQCNAIVDSVTSTGGHTQLGSDITVSMASAVSVLASSFNYANRTDTFLIACITGMNCQRLTQVIREQGMYFKAIYAPLCLATTDRFLDPLESTTQERQDREFVMGISRWSPDDVLMSSLSNMTGYDFISAYNASFSQQPSYKAAYAFAAMEKLASAISGVSCCVTEDDTFAYADPSFSEVQTKMNESTSLIIGRNVSFDSGGIFMGGWQPSQILPTAPWVAWDGPSPLGYLMPDTFSYVRQRQLSYPIPSSSERTCMNTSLSFTNVGYLWSEGSETTCDICPTGYIARWYVPVADEPMPSAGGWTCIRVILQVNGQNGSSVALGPGIQLGVTGYPRAAYAFKISDRGIVVDGTKSCLSGSYVRSAGGDILVPMTLQPAFNTTMDELSFYGLLPARGGPLRLCLCWDYGGTSPCSRRNDFNFDAGVVTGLAPSDISASGLGATVLPGQSFDLLLSGASGSFPYPAADRIMLRNRGDTCGSTGTSTVSTTGFKKGIGYQAFYDGPTSVRSMNSTTAVAGSLFSSTDFGLKFDIQMLSMPTDIQGVLWLHAAHSCWCIGKHPRLDWYTLHR